MVGYLNKVYAFWLVPADPLKARLRKLIDTLASENFGTGFDPHVTIYAGASTDREAQNIVQRMGREFSSIVLTTDKLEHSALYTKTLFIQLDYPPPLHEFVDCVHSQLAQRSDYQLNPHLSLLYTTMQDEDRAKLAGTVKWPKGKYHFNKIAVIECEQPITERDQVINWRKVAEADLLEPIPQPTV